MGFLSSIISTTVKTVLTPVAVVKDVVNVVAGEDASATRDHVESITDDIDDIIDSI
jgi:hypothetical protein